MKWHTILHADVEYTIEKLDAVRAAIMEGHTEEDLAWARTELTRLRNHLMDDLARASDVQRERRSA